MKKKNLLSVVLVIVLCIMTVQPVSAATKYTNAERKLAQTLANYQDNELIDPDSFKIRHIYKVRYSLKSENYEAYDAWGLLDSYKNLAWEIDYTAKNSFGGTVRDTLYISSTYYYTNIDDIDFDEYNDKTNYKTKNRSKAFVNKIKKLTKKYYDEL